MQALGNTSNRRQPRLPSSFWLMAIVCTLFLVGSAWQAWQLYARPYDDLPSFYWATRLTWEQGWSAYQPEHFQELSRSFGQRVYPFLYPPPSLILFSPFLICEDYKQAKLFFSVFNLVLWWVLAFALCQASSTFCKHASRFMWAIPLFMLVYFPCADTLKNGQVNLLVLICLLPCLFPQAGRWRQWAAGVLFACAVMLKVYVLLLLPILIWYRRWQETGSAILTMLLLAGGSLLLLPAGLWQDWFALGGRAGYGTGVAQVLTVPFNQSFNGFFIRQFLYLRSGGGASSWIFGIYVVVAVHAAAAAWLLVLRLGRGMATLSPALALVLLLVNLIAPLSWIHHYVFALPALLWAAHFSGQGSLAPPVVCGRLIAPLLALAAILLALPFLPAAFFGGGVMKGTPGGGMPLLDNIRLSISLAGGTLLFWVLLVQLAASTKPVTNRPS